MKKVTITKQDGSVGTLTRGDDGKWSISLNGKPGPANYYYNDDQVAKIVQQSTAAGVTVVTA